MRTLCLPLVALAMASGTFAQGPSGRAGRFYGPLATGVWTAKTPQANGRPLFAGVLPQTFVLAPPEAPTCSVPLLEAQIPKDVHFTIKQIHARLENLEPMPHAIAPAPPCDPPSRR